MNIAIIGGRYKNMTQLSRIAANDGHHLDVHEGHLQGNGVHEIRRVISRADVVVILTSINSHGAMHVAKEWAKQLGTPTLIVRNMGAARLRTLLEAVDRRSELGWPWPEANTDASLSAEPSRIATQLRSVAA
jgi:hypothetical protein